MPTNPGSLGFRVGCRPTFVYFCAILLVLSWLAPAADLPEAPRKVITPAAPVSQESQISLEIGQLEVAEAMQMLANATGFSIILSNSVTGKVTAYLTDMNPEQALEETVRLNGFHYVKNDNVVWVMSDKEFFEDFNMGRERRVFQLTQAKAEQVCEVLQGSLSKQGVAIPYPETNLVVIADLKERIADIEELVGQLDSCAGTKVVQLKHAVAADMVGILKPYVATPYGIQADVRTNQILLKGTEATVARLEALIEQFDKPEKVMTKVFPLKFANAEETADLLREVLTGRKQSSQGGYGDMQQYGQGSGRQNQPQYMTTQPGREAPVSPSPTASGGVPASTSDQGKFAPAAGAKAATPMASWERYRGAGKSAGTTAAAGAPTAAANTPSSQSLEDVALGPLATIAADARTNSIIITHVQSVIDRIQEIIKGIDVPNEFHVYQFKNVDPKELDIPARLAGVMPVKAAFINVDSVTRKVTFRAPEDQAADIEKLLREWDEQIRQVHIEAEILRVNSRLLRELGVDWQVLLNKVNGGSALDATVTWPANVATGEPQTRLSVGNLETSDYNVVLQALATDSGTEVIARPKILVRSGQQAVFSSSRDEPYTVVSVSGQTQTTLQDVKFLNVGVSLMVEPIINKNDQVAIQVQLEISALVEYRNNIPVVDRATAQSSVNVVNGGTVILGGLKEHSLSNNEGGVPILKNMPVMGALFRNRRKEHAETEIVLILHPNIIGSTQDAPKIGDIGPPINFNELEPFFDSKRPSANRTSESHKNSE